jgi:hypothetical protein
MIHLTKCSWNIDLHVDSSQLMLSFSLEPVMVRISEDSVTFCTLKETPKKLVPTV